jgi:tRNA pseudouridine38-40 synthase
MTMYRLTLEYDGTRFSGWQAQPGGARTVEGALREALAALAEGDPTITAAGRTDAGAHAHGQVAGVRLVRAWDPRRLQAALNAHLPQDAVVVHAETAAPSFHARHHAASRTYRYLVLARSNRPAVLRSHAWSVPGPLDLIAMREAAGRLLGRHDFGSFGRATWSGGTTVRTVLEARVDPLAVPRAGVTRIEGACITVTADAFLRGMMRAFAGALVAVGRGRMALETFQELITGASPTARSVTVAPARGLHQWCVSYVEDGARGAGGPLAIGAAA